MHQFQVEIFSSVFLAWCLFVHDPCTHIAGLSYKLSDSLSLLLSLSLSLSQFSYTLSWSLAKSTISLGGHEITMKFEHRSQV